MSIEGFAAQVDALVTELAALLSQQGMMLATAESCTGGWVAKVCTDRPGSSKWFERGFVTYTNEAKQEMLGVSPSTLQQYGAVSEQTVMEMVAGALTNSHAQLALAISGIAGPGGGSEEKPVGTVCFAWGVKDADLNSLTRHFAGDREAVRAQAVIEALKVARDLLDHPA